jgi:hypothetical protein
MGNLPRSMRAKSLQDYSMMPSCSARLARAAMLEAKCAPNAPRARVLPCAASVRNVVAP